MSNYLSQRSLTEREMLSRELSARQTLYSEFIQFGTSIYISATTKESDDASDLVAIYALVGRIRLFASEPVIEAAEQFAKRMTERFGEASMTLEDLRSATLTNHVDPLNDFSARCRSELRLLLRGKS